jgi:hypothetical protein
VRYAAILVLGCMRALVVAEPAPASQQDDDQGASAKDTPWIDLAPPKLLDTREPPERDHKLASAVTLAGIYAGFTTWTYFAWYRGHAQLEDYQWGGDGDVRIWHDKGWFGPGKYAGGADKLGHAWACMGLTRGGTELLTQWGGYRRLPASIVSGALAEALFVGVEIKDGFYYEFSWGDLVLNTTGVALGVALSNWPRLDELIDFRVQWWPSKAYRRQLEAGNVGKKLNIAEDYSGETYLLAFHLGGIHALRDASWGGWSRFVDVAIGFGTRGYKPDPPPGYEGDYDKTQHLSIGFSLNAQGVFDWLLDGRSRAWRKITHGTFEVFNLPFSYVPAVEGVRHAPAIVDQGGA